MLKIDDPWTLRFARYRRRSKRLTASLFDISSNIDTEKHRESRQTFVEASKNVCTAMFSSCFFFLIPSSYSSIVIRNRRITHSIVESSSPQAAQSIRTYVLTEFCITDDRHFPAFFSPPVDVAALVAQVFFVLKEIEPTQTHIHTLINAITVDSVHGWTPSLYDVFRLG